MMNPTHKPVVTVSLVSILAGLGFIPTALATFSIAATDNATGQIGAAGASCVPCCVYEVLYHGVPGHGVLVTQAKPPSEGSPVYTTGTSMLEDDSDPADIIATISDPELDTDNSTLPLFDSNGNFTGEMMDFPGPSLRQYGVVDLMGRPHAFTGELIEFMYVNVLGATEELAGNHTQEHKTGTLGSYSFTSQQNIVTSNIVPDLVRHFANASCNDLVGRLYAALRSAFEPDDGSQDFRGDVRCRNLNLSASTAFLHVSNPDGSEMFHAQFTEDELGSGVSPFTPIREAYEAWRADNPCVLDDSTGEEMTSPTGSPNGGASESNASASTGSESNASASTGSLAPTPPSLHWMVLTGAVVLLKNIY